MLKSKNPGKSDDNVHKTKHCTKQAVNSCVLTGVKKAPKKQHMKSDSTSNEKNNTINKFRSLPISDSNSNDKENLKDFGNCCGIDELDNGTRNDMAINKH
eukprot:12214717-Ditylum_brightwellii.AAC.1